MVQQHNRGAELLIIPALDYPPQTLSLEGETAAATRENNTAVLQKSENRNTI